jgi:hypothetical protein
MTEDCRAHSLPSSAAGHLEPYGCRIVLEPLTGSLAPEDFLVSFLEDLAVACRASGASLIGHLKCLLHLPGGTLACNLTSVQGGARCSSLSSSGAPPLAPGQSARLDLAVLVYGLPAPALAGLVRDALNRLLEPSAGAWWADTGDVG